MARDKKSDALKFCELCNIKGRVIDMIESGKSVKKVYRCPNCGREWITSD